MPIYREVRNPIDEVFSPGHLDTHNSTFFYQKKTRADSNNQVFFRRNNHTGVPMHKIRQLPRKCRTPPVSKEVELTRIRDSLKTNDENGDEGLAMCMNSHGKQFDDTCMVGLTAVPDADALIDQGLITMDIKYRNPDRFKHRSDKYTFELNRASQAMREIRRGYEALTRQDQNACVFSEPFSETF
jgi:hypothetical protein